MATSVVETDRPRPQVERFKDTWPIPQGDDYTLYDYVHFGGPIVDAPKLRDLIDLLHPTAGMSLGELALRMLHLIADRFEYRKGITTAASPITDALDSGAGVCQDFTHLMIGLARALGIPARYVSGLIHPEAERFRGFTQTHAWCELLFPSAGWVGFDPTNNCPVGPHFVKVAVGRDYRDVPPEQGPVAVGREGEGVDRREGPQPDAHVDAAGAGRRAGPVDRHRHLADRLGRPPGDGRAPSRDAAAAAAAAAATASGFRLTRRHEDAKVKTSERSSSWLRAFV